MSLAQPEKIVLLIVTLMLGVLSVWLQFVFLEARELPAVTQVSKEPDYYLENFTAVGMDETGKRRYLLEAERLAHFPEDDTALLDNPHIIQYFDDAPPRHTYSESAWVAPDGEEVLLTGNVKVIQGRGDESDPGGIMTTDKMRVRLKEKIALR